MFSWAVFSLLPPDASSQMSHTCKQSWFLNAQSFPLKNTNSLYQGTARALQVQRALHIQRRKIHFSWKRGQHVTRNIPIYLNKKQKCPRGKGTERSFAFQKYFHKTVWKDHSNSSVVCRLSVWAESVSAGSSLSDCLSLSLFLCLSVYGQRFLLMRSSTPSQSVCMYVCKRER